MDFTSRAFIELNSLKIKRDNSLFLIVQSSVELFPNILAVFYKSSTKMNHRQLILVFIMLTSSFATFVYLSR